MRKGLKTLGLLAEMVKYPNLFRSAFIFNPIRLTSFMIDEIFLPKLSPVGSDKRLVENTVLGYWRDYIQDSEGIYILYSDCFCYAPYQKIGGI
jgi:hypothetical protein